MHANAKPVCDIQKKKTEKIKGRKKMLDNRESLRRRSEKQEEEIKNK